MQTAKVRFVIFSVGLLTCAATAVGQTQPATGSLAWYAQQAKSKGQPAATISLNLESSMVSEDLNRVLQTSEVVVATSAETSGGTMQAETHVIRTWYKFHILRRISPGHGSDTLQVEPPKELGILSAGDLAVGLTTGSSTVDGILVNVQSEESSIRWLPGQRYLLILKPVSARAAVLTHSLHSIFVIAQGGRIESAVDGTNPQYARQLISLGTIDALSEYARNLPTNQPR